MKFDNRRDDFPNVTSGNYAKKSEDSPNYNCFALAASDTQRWWSPAEDYFWPIDERKLTLPAFVAAYQSLGYAPCELDESLEEQTEKVAIYVSSTGEPMHAAKQLPNGKWISKLGDDEDIEHDSLKVLEGPFYGRPEIILKRRRPE
jgi:hypothetical protein